MTGAARFVALTLVLGCASGCIAWRSYVEPGVAGFPASVRAEEPANARLSVSVLAWRAVEGADGEAPQASPDDTVRLLELLAEANLFRDVGADLGLADLALRVTLRSRTTGHRWLAYLTVATLGVVPFFGGRQIEAEAEVLDGDGRRLLRWTSRAEVTQVAHLLLLTAWNPKAVEQVSADALKGVVARLARDRDRLLSGDATRDGPTGSDPPGRVKER